MTPGGRGGPVFWVLCLHLPVSVDRPDLSEESQTECPEVAHKHQLRVRGECQADCVHPQNWCLLTESSSPVLALTLLKAWRCWWLEDAPAPETTSSSPVHTDPELQAWAGAPLMLSSYADSVLTVKDGSGLLSIGPSHLLAFHQHPGPVKPTFLQRLRHQ